MRFREVALVAIGLVCLAVFAWSLTIMCSRPAIAHPANWFSSVVFALLGPAWATSNVVPVSNGRMIPAFLTVVIAFFGVLVAPPFELACRQTSSTSDSWTASNALDPKDF